MVIEQYNSKALRDESTLLTECSELAGRTSGDRRYNGERGIFVEGEALLLEHLQKHTLRNFNSATLPHFLLAALLFLQ